MWSVEQQTFCLRPRRGPLGKREFFHKVDCLSQFLFVLGKTQEWLYMIGEKVSVAGFTILGFTKNAD